MAEFKLTIKRKITRASADALAAFASASTGWVADANGRRGAVDAAIRPLTRAMRFHGTALTVHTRPSDNLAPYAAIEFAQPGDVLMVAAEGYAGASLVGDVLLGMARNKGIVAIVVDGAVRDIDGLNAVGIPVFARALTPNSPQKDGPGAIGLPVSLGGVTIASGDIVVGDQDGVVVVSREAAQQVIAGLAEIAAKERAMDELVRSGATAHAWLAPLLKSEAVRFVD